MFFSVADETVRYSQRFSTSRAKDTVNVGHLSNYKCTNYNWLSTMYSSQ